jgi:hypothetical protein
MDILFAWPTNIQVKMYRLSVTIAFCGLFILSPKAMGDHWGFYAHRQINELAIYTLPPEMFAFYKANLNFLREHAVDPDKRRYSVVGEAQKHYIDIDHYCVGEGCDPFENMPRRWYDAVEKFSEDTLQAYGIAPWNISLMVTKLTTAFEENRLDRILRLSAEIGHYIGDAHVPLHTTENYNGQLTNQKGIHGFWESRLPELFDGNYDFFVGKAKYVDSPLNATWDVIEQSHHALDSVLRFEAELNATWPSDKKYVYAERGQAIIKTYSEEYSAAYHDMLNGQVERRMQQAVVFLGSIWYTAWVNAGQPDLNVLMGITIPEDVEKLIEQENTLAPVDGLKGREHDQ